MAHRSVIGHDRENDAGEFCNAGQGSQPLHSLAQSERSVAHGPDFDRTPQTIVSSRSFKRRAMLAPHPSYPHEADLSASDFSLSRVTLRSC